MDNQKQFAPGFIKRSKDEIPKEWDVVRLGDKNLCDIIMGQSPPSFTYNQTGEGLPFLQGKMEFGEIYPNPNIYCSEPIKIAEEKNILISVRAPVGDVNIAPSRVCIGRGLAAIKCKPEKINYLYLFYYLKYNAKKFESISAGSTFKAIRKNELDNFTILLPPLPEQRKIASILSTVDEAIQKVDEAIAKTERLKRGLMQRLLTRGIGHREFKDTEVGRIPKEWEVVKLIDCSNKPEYGYTASATEKHAGPKLLRITDLKDEGVDWNSVPYCSCNLDVVKKYLLKDGDIVVARIGATTGKAYLVKNVPKAVFASYLIRIRMKDNILPGFLNFYFQSRIYWIQVTQNKGGRLKGGLNIPQILNLKIPLPPLPEQRKIASILSTVDKKLELERKRKEKLERIKRGLMKDLLNGKVRVKE